MVTVFVVDDEPGFRHILSVVLQRAGYHVVQANDAHETLHLMESQTPNLIILDDMMPGMSGSDLCLKLKADARYSHIPIVMHTANARFNNPMTVKNIGADGVMLKPCTPADILAEITRFLQAPT
jgi:DNA-binding response OmpR family regulator